MEFGEVVLLLPDRKCSHFPELQRPSPPGCPPWLSAAMQTLDVENHDDSEEKGECCAAVVDSQHIDNLPKHEQLGQEDVAGSLNWCRDNLDKDKEVQGFSGPDDVKTEADEQDREGGLEMHQEQQEQSAVALGKGAAFPAEVS